MPCCVGEHDMHSLAQEECGNGLLQAIVPSLCLGRPYCEAVLLKNTDLNLSCLVHVHVVVTEEDHRGSGRNV